MDEMLQEVGKNIKLYRKAKGYTLDQFSECINKSKSTLSKYENGSIVIDIVTLMEICDALDISINQLIRYKPAARAKKDLAYGRNSFFNVDVLYLYFFDGRNNKLVKGMMHLDRNIGENTTEPILYMNIPDFENYTKCEHLYYGKLDEFDSVSTIIFENQNSDIEKLMVSIINPIHIATTTVALVAGISSYPIMPIAFKCMLSKEPLAEDDPDVESLKITKEDIRHIKRLNMFLVKNFG